MEAPDPYPPLHWPAGRRPPERKAAAIISFIFVFSLLALLTSCVFHSTNTAWWTWGLLAVVLITWYLSVSGMFRDEGPTIKQLHAQLIAREMYHEELWGSAQRMELARFAAKTIADEIGWPNSNFIPDDPIAVLLFCPLSDGGEFMAIVFDIERKYGMKHRARINPASTFGEFVDSFHK